jgi:hypothetical protein
MALGCTVVSTLIRSKLEGRTAPLSSPAWIVVASSVSSSSGPSRLRQRVSELGSQGEALLEVLTAAEPLPIGILDPALHHRFIGQIESVLEIGQPHHQPRGFGRPAERAVEAAEFLIEAIPVEQTGQAKELVAMIQDLIETAAVEIAGARQRWFGSHGKTPTLSGSAPRNRHFTMLRGDKKSFCPNKL